MKKLNFLKAVPAAFLILFCFSACKSLEQSIPAVDAMAVLEDDSAVYFKIPVAKHSEFAKKLLCSAVPGLTEDNADYLIPKVNTMCAGLGKIGAKSLSSRVQVSVDGYLPPIAVNAALTEKNGWKMKKSSVSAKISGISVPCVYYERKDTDFKLGLASLKNVVFAKDIDPLLKHYSAQLDSLYENGTVLQPEKNWTNSTYDWMTSSSDNIRFCVLYPQAFIKNLLGVELNFAIANARGTFTEKEEDFILSIEIEFQNNLVVNAAKAFLSLYYGKSVSFETSANVLKVANISLSQEKVLNLISGNIK